MLYLYSTYKCRTQWSGEIPSAVRDGFADALGRDILKLARIVQLWDTFCKPVGAKQAMFGKIPLQAIATWFSLVASTLVIRAAETVDYQRQVRPLLSDKCFRCHGPDQEERQAGLRLDDPKAILLPTQTGRYPVVPGNPEASEIVRRIYAEESSERMPPPESGKQLTDQERELLRRWIEQGATTAQHWAFVVPNRPALPSVQDRSWPRNAIDYFVLARLEAEGLRPAPEADRYTLARRVALDLTGLPPTWEEVRAFVEDPHPDAYERFVDRLLANVHFGERMALDWLDAARYADTHGYHIDSGRQMWAWRKWVIDAFNRNLPYDQFVIEQLAGDLLPNPTRDQLIATGFNRNHMINFEGGAIPEEYHTAYVVDRVNTTGAVFLGLTLGCAQCHDHKYDPISQREYYQLYAFFNNVPEKGLDGSQGNAAPFISVLDQEQERQLAVWQEEEQKLHEQLTAENAEWDHEQETWEAAIKAAGPDVQWTALKPPSVSSRHGASFRILEDASVLFYGSNPEQDVHELILESDRELIRAIRLEALADASFASGGAGRSENSNFVLTHFGAEYQPLAGQDDWREVRFKRAVADYSQNDFDVSSAIDQDPKSGWAVDGHQKPESRWAIFVAQQPFGFAGGTRLRIRLHYESIYARHVIGRPRILITSDPRAGLDIPNEVAVALEVSTEKRTKEQRDLVRSFFRQNVSVHAAEVRRKLESVREQRRAWEASLPTTMIMQEMPQPRTTYFLIRGQYDRRGDVVQPGVPSSLPPVPEGAPANRLGLAQWLVSPRQPLTARVTVNRYWQMFFGTGLVKTAEDFGSQGERPSHPELLDWLAVEFREPSPAPLGTGSSGAWDIKALVRLIVTSATYRQTSSVGPQAYQRDPENRLLARGPRFRLQAELLRDQALALSGLLDRRIGGPSVYPYQPPGLWEELAYREDGKKWTAQTYVQSHGTDLYRRSMYIFWKRTSPPPTMTAFDAPDRETCTLRRSRTNTPLQALITMNDPTFVEAARHLAERILREGGASDQQRLAYLWRTALLCEPRGEQLDVLARLLDEQRAHFERQRAQAEALLGVGESPRDTSLDVADVAAWTIVCSVILNMDQLLCRG